MYLQLIAIIVDAVHDNLPPPKSRSLEGEQKLESNIKIYSKHIQVEMQKIEDVNRDIILYVDRWGENCSMLTIKEFVGGPSW